MAHFRGEHLYTLPNDSGVLAMDSMRDDFPMSVLAAEELKRDGTA